MLGGATLVAMMKSTHLRDRHDTTSVWWLDAAPLGRILFQTQVRTAPMSFRTSMVVIAGVELAGKIKKRQFKIGKLGGSTATMPQMWKLPWPRSASMTFKGE
jgi:hypothetical protein